MVAPKPIAPLGRADAKTQAFNAALEQLLKAAPPPGAVPVEDIRRLRAEGKGVLPIDGPLPEGAWVAIDSAGLGAPGGPNRARLVAAESPKGVYLHIHGGGWTFGGADQSDGRNLRLARAAGLSVISVQYRFAPENPWPACGDDCFAAARFALDYAKRAGGLPLFIGGESAGAHLSAVTLLRLRDDLGVTGAFEGAVFNYGCFDLRMTPSMRNWGPRNLVLSTPIVDWFVGNLLPDRGLADSPKLSPLLADLRDMPPALFQCGGEDPLWDDTAFMAQRWRAAGAEADMALYPGGVHGFDYFDQPRNNLPLALEAQATQAAWVKARLG